MKMVLLHDIMSFDLGTLFSSRKKIETKPAKHFEYF